MTGYLREFYFQTFRTVLERNKICFIETADKNRKRIDNESVDPFNFLVLNESAKKNYIVHVIGNKYPKEHDNYSVDCRLKIAGSKTLDLERSKVWEKFFVNFSSLIIFVYIIKDTESKEKFLNVVKNAGEVFRYKIRGVFYWVGITAIPVNQYLDYLNKENLPKNDAYVKEKDLASELKSFSALLL